MGSACKQVPMIHLESVNDCCDEFKWALDDTHNDKRVNFELQIDK